MLGAAPTSIGALWVCDEHTAKSSDASPALALSRAATSEVIDSGTPRLSTVTITPDFGSEPKAIALTQSLPPTPEDSVLRLE